MRRITKLCEREDTVPLTPKAKLRVAAYCRVSTDSGAQLQSLQVQKAHYVNYIQKNPDWEFAGLYCDSGLSGTKKEKRPALMRLIADCENRKVDFIVTKSISRFARSTTDCLELVRRLAGMGIFLFFEKENIHTGRMDDELILTILSSLAESESVSLSENSKWGVQKRFQNGTYKFSSVPYGYDLADGRLRVNPAQAAAVRHIFSETLAGKGPQEIAGELLAEGLPTQKGGRWSASSVRDILANEKYTGDALCQKTYTDEHFNRHRNYGGQSRYLIRDHHEPIVSRETFEAAAACVARRRAEKGIEQGSDKYWKRYPFSGKIFCGACGAVLKRRIQYRGELPYVAWSCSRHLERKEDCPMKFIREDAIRRAFVLMMNKLIFGHRLVLRPLLQELRRMNDASGTIAELETRMQECEKQRATLVALLAKGYLEIPLFHQQNAELQRETAKLREKKNTLCLAANANSEKMEAAGKLLRFVSQSKLVSAFDESLFSDFVGRIIVCSREELGFELKCGVTLRERLENK